MVRPVVPLPGSLALQPVDHDEAGAPLQVAPEALERARRSALVGAAILRASSFTANRSPGRSTERIESSTPSANICRGGKAIRFYLLFISACKPVDAPAQPVPASRGGGTFLFTILVQHRLAEEAPNTEMHELWPLRNTSNSLQIRNTRTLQSKGAHTWTTNRRPQ